MNTNSFGSDIKEKLQLTAVRKAQKILKEVSEADTGTGDYLESVAREALKDLDMVFGENKK